MIMIRTHALGGVGAKLVRRVTFSFSASSKQNSKPFGLSPDCYVTRWPSTSSSMPLQPDDCAGSHVTGFLLKNGQGGTTTRKVTAAPARRIHKLRAIFWVE